MVVKGFSQEAVGRPTHIGNMSIVVLNLEGKLVRLLLRSVLVVLKLELCFISEDCMTRNGAIIEIVESHANVMIRESCE